MLTPEQIGRTIKSHQSTQSAQTMQAIAYYLNIGKAPAIVGTLAALAVVVIANALHFPGF